MRVTIYARVSAKRDAQKNSLKNQISCATNRATLSGWTIVGQYIDNGISGATREKRAELQRLLRDAKKKKFDAVIAKSVSRLGRNTIENLQTTHEAVLAEEESSKQSDRI